MELLLSYHEWSEVVEDVSQSNEDCRFTLKPPEGGVFLLQSLLLHQEQHELTTSGLPEIFSSLPQVKKSQQVGIRNGQQFISASPITRISSLKRFV